MWSFDNDRAIYLQIMDNLIIDILSNKYPDKLPTVRDLATEIKVNPNTVQKAYSELEKLNIIETQRTNGRFVTNDLELLNKVKIDLACQDTLVYLNKMKSLQFTKNEIIDLISEVGKDEENDNTM